MQVKQFVEWKKAYIDRLMEKLQPKGRVLQVGFGNGYAACRIQDFHPKSHIIIEKDPQMAKEAKKWATGFSHVTVLEGPWQKVLGKQSNFETFFYNDVTLEDDVEMLKRKPPREAVDLVNEAKQTLQKLKTQISKLQIKYSDEEIDHFCAQLGKEKLEEFPTFFLNLKNGGFITEKQYERVQKKYAFSTEAPALKQPLESDDPFLHFVRNCLDKHSVAGSRISCYMVDTSSKFEDPAFFEKVITDPEVHFDEELITIHHPACDIHQALLLQIEKLR